uniref:Uncharacterized protein n=1 Tax=Oryza meridionalis TaxID=40149 RepID=A0A0E0F2R7_9ORYZ
MGYKVGTKSIAQIAHELVNGLQQCKFGKQPIKRLMEHGLFLMANEFRYISLLMTTCFFRFRPKLYDMCQCIF